MRVGSGSGGVVGKGVGEGEGVGAGVGVGVGEGVATAAGVGVPAAVCGFTHPPASASSAHITTNNIRFIDFPLCKFCNAALPKLIIPCAYRAGKPVTPVFPLLKRGYVYNSLF